MLDQFLQVVICDLSQPQIPRFAAFKVLLNMARLNMFVFIVASAFQCTRQKKRYVHTGNRSGSSQETHHCTG